METWPPRRARYRPFTLPQQNLAVPAASPGRVERLPLLMFLLRIPEPAWETLARRPHRYRRLLPASPSLPTGARMFRIPVRSLSIHLLLERALRFNWQP